MDVACLNDGDENVGIGRLVAKIEDVEVGRTAVPEVERGGTIQTSVQIDTKRVRSKQDYTLTISWKAGERVIMSAARPISIARRPSPDRMTVWLWPHGVYSGYTADFDQTARERIDWWAGVGFNSFCGSSLELWNYALTKGSTICFEPDGGLVGVTLKSDDPDIDYRDANGAIRTEGSAGSKRNLANPFHPLVAQWQDERNSAHMRLIARYPQVQLAFFNTEVIDELGVRNGNKAGDRMIREELGFPESEVDDPPKYARLHVVADDARKLVYNKYIFKRGNGLVKANARAAAVIHSYRPDILTINDPYRSYALLDGFTGIDVVGTWTYLNPDPKLMFNVENLRAACRDGGKIPLSTVTLLNYPGQLAPTDRWMMMGPGRLAVGTWINLSRAPRLLCYYFGSQLDPFAAADGNSRTAEADEQVREFERPKETHQKLRELSDKVFKPYGPLIKQLAVSPRKVAVLTSQTARLYGRSKPLLGYYPVAQPLHFYTVLAMAQIPADVVLEETIQRWGLDGYDALVLPKCDVLPQSVYDAILAFQKRGGLVIADQNLGPDVPNSIRFDFDFSYRDGVTATAIANNQTQAGGDDHVDPQTAEQKKVKGVTALDDQRIMESYARRLRERLKDRIVRRVDCEEPTALLNLTEADGVNYLFVVNDRREYGPRLGKFKAVLEKIAPQQVEVKLLDSKLSDAVAYDLLARRPLENSNGSIKVDLDDLGGTIIALYPRKIVAMELNVPKTAVRNTPYCIGVDLRDDQGGALPGIQPLRVALIDPNGVVADASDYYVARKGALRILITPALNDALGRWTVKVEDLTAGMSAQSSLMLTN